MDRVPLPAWRAEGLTVDEIAGVVGVPAGTVKSRIHHAKKALAALLEGHGHE